MDATFRGRAVHSFSNNDRRLPNSAVLLSQNPLWEPAPGELFCFHPFHDRFQSAQQQRGSWSSARAAINEFTFTEMTENIPGGWTTIAQCSWHTILPEYIEVSQWFIHRSLKKLKKHMSVIISHAALVLKYKIISSAHDEVFAGHSGFCRTLTWLSYKYQIWQYNIFFDKQIKSLSARILLQTERLVW